VSELLHVPMGELGPEIWLAQAHPDAPLLECPGRYAVAGSARLLRRLTWDQATARRFGLSSALRVLPLFETAVPGDGRPRRALDVLGQVVDGRATAEIAEAYRTADAAFRAAPGGAAASAASSVMAACSRRDWAKGVAWAGRAARHLLGAGETARQVAALTAVLGLTAAETSAFRVPADTAAA
jgi:hypothetical protein